EFTCDNGRIFSVTLAPVVESGYVNAYGYDITDRKDIEERQQLGGQILECLNRESVGADLIRDVLKLIKKATNLDAVGIRQHKGNDFPYLEVNGFPDDFVKTESHLCVHSKAGKLILDSDGRPALECMCGVVLYDRTDPTLPFFTEGGSFWTNSTTELLTSIPQEDLQVPTRNRCNEAGYESVALIPLRSGDEIVGLLQLNDTRKERFTSEMVRFFEEIGASIGIGLARIRAEQEVENQARFPSENPYPVLRILKDSTVLYANAAGSELLGNWGCKVGTQAPEHWHKNILRTLKSRQSENLEVVCRDRMFSLTIAPVTDSGYANLYGTDITERKQAEENLRNYRQQLEELVHIRTAELTETNKKLMEEIEGRKQLEKEILNISEREQKRIGQELHDSIGQQFTGIAFLTKVLEQKLTKNLSDEATDAAEIKKLVNQAMGQMRSLARGLHPVDLDAGSFISALQELAATTENLFGIRCTFKYDRPIQIDDTEVATHLYRITQEAITNAIKHGKTNNIHIELGQKRDKSVLKIENDGLDFPEEFGAKGTGMGLQIMDHRADIIGASLDIHKAPEGGTIVTCSFLNKTN
ncbi:MAG: histidine kinase, partial [Planctomycetota bacterium]